MIDGGELKGGESKGVQYYLWLKKKTKQRGPTWEIVHQIHTRFH